MSNVLQYFSNILYNTAGIFTNIYPLKLFKSSIYLKNLWSQPCHGFHDFNDFEILHLISEYKPPVTLNIPLADSPFVFPHIKTSFRINLTKIIFIEGFYCHASSWPWFKDCLAVTPVKYIQVKWFQEARPIFSVKMSTVVYL